MLCYYMSPVSPVFHTITVNIEHQFHSSTTILIKHLTLFQPTLIQGEQEWDRQVSRSRYLALSNSLRRADLGTP